MFTHPLMLLSASGLITSVIGGLSSSSLLGVWVAMELNMLSFVIFIQICKSSQSYSVSKYFVVQSLGSLFLLLSVILCKGVVISGVVFWGLLLGLLLKAGLPPFHFWFVSVMGESGAETLFLLSTWQKILVLYMIIKLSPGGLISFLIGASALIGCLGALPQTRVSKVMAYSSIISSGWVMASIPHFKLGLMYLLTYSIGLGVWLSSLFEALVGGLSLKGGSSTLFSKRGSLTVALLSMGGLPPMLGFFIKLCLLLEMSHSFLYSAVLILLSAAAPMLYVYLRTLLLSLKSQSAGLGAGEVWSQNYIFLSGSGIVLLTSGLVCLL